MMKTTKMQCNYRRRRYYNNNELMHRKIMLKGEDTRAVNYQIAASYYVSIFYRSSINIAHLRLQVQLVQRQQRPRIE